MMLDDVGCDLLLLINLMFWLDVFCSCFVFFKGVE